MAGKEWKDRVRPVVKNAKQRRLCFIMESIGSLSTRDVIRSDLCLGSNVENGLEWGH